MFRGQLAASARHRLFLFYPPQSSVFKKGFLLRVSDIKRTSVAVSFPSRVQALSGNVDTGASVVGTFTGARCCGGSVLCIGKGIMMVVVMMPLH